VHALAGEGARPHKMPDPTPLAKYNYRRRLPHLQKADAVFFITFCTNGRLCLPETARDLVLEHCLREQGKRIRLNAVVVMPSHVHLLAKPLRDKNGWPFPLVNILQCLKSTTAHRINKLHRTSGPVWEEESFDHLLRSEESLKEKCEYIRQNPVRAGLVTSPEDYRWLWMNPEVKF
jgi:REP element-mobilizing transposase RayT